MENESPQKSLTGGAVHQEVARLSEELRDRLLELDNWKIDHARLETALAQEQAARLRLERVMAFYADKASYGLVPVSNSDLRVVSTTMVLLDGGAQARAALNA